MQYLVVGLGDLDARDLASALSRRPSFGVGLADDLGASCLLGNLEARGTDLLAQVRQTELPPRGSRVVLWRPHVESLLAAAWLLLEARSDRERARGRLHALEVAIRRSRDAGRWLEGCDPTQFEDDDPTVVRTVLCDVLGRRAPLIYRLEVATAYLAGGDFVGRPAAIRRLRRRLEWQLCHRVTAVDEPEVRVTSAPVVHPIPRVGARRPVLCATEGSQLRDLITSDANLYGAWERVRDRAREQGRWGPTYARFESRLSSHLRDLAIDLREHRWRPGQPAHVRLPKPNGATRHLHVPPLRDRIAERAVAVVVGGLIDPYLSPASFAFRPGRGVADAVTELRERRDDGCTHVARFDIADCFGSVQHDRLRHALRGYLDDPWLAGFIDQLLERELPGTLGGGRLVGLAQGSPLSPLLANVVLEDLDAGMFRGGYAPIRYADDVAVAVRSREDTRAALQVAGDRAADLDLRVQPAKSSVASFDETVEFLGERIGSNAEVPGAAEFRMPARRHLYLTSRTSHVQVRRGQVRALARDGSEVASVPLAEVGRVVVSGPVNVSAGLRSQALRSDLDVVFLSRNGGWLGRYDGGLDSDPALRRSQYALSDDLAARTSIGATMVSGKIANQRALLQRYGRRRDGSSNADAVDALGDLGRDVLTAANPAAVMGYEGVAAKRYQAALRGLFPASAGFTRRTKRPPRDPANAALSFGYTLLTGEAHAACEIAGLDAQIGILHSSGRRRAALALDLVEEFRPLIVDTIVLAAFRRRQLTEVDVRRTDDGAVLLNDRGRRRVIDLYETRMLSRPRSVHTGVAQTYRDTLREQGRHLAATVRGDVATYQPVPWR